ncbi:MAG: FG-GAP-like repeat-containing protein [Pseudomonadota bacterium]
MVKLLNKFLMSLSVASIFILAMSAYEPQSRALAFGGTQAFVDRLEQLTGLDSTNIDGLYAVEQRPDIVMIAYEITIPVMRTPAAQYLLIRNATTGAWTRVLIDKAEWQSDFRPYFDSRGIKVHKQSPGTFEGLTPAAEAAALQPNDVSAQANADVAIYGNVGGPGGSVEAAPQPFNTPIPAQSTALASDKIGITAGDFRVSESGAATYTIPIALPGGTAGVAPSIALNYSSAAGNGIAGMGWSLSGLSSISRCRATLGQDADPAPITFTNEDKFCLDGQRLLLVAGTHAQVGATYRTEVDSGVVVEIASVSNGEPQTFTAKRSDGSTTYYGLGPDGDTNTSASLTNPSYGTLNWSIRAFKDVVGNPIWFDYTTTASQQVISQIRYAFGADKSNPDATGNARVTFGYLLRDDKQRGFIAGFETISDQLLDKIKVFNSVATNVTGQPTEQENREYRLEYGQDYAFEGGDAVAGNTPLPDVISRLTDIYECAGNECLNPTHFEWARPVYDAADFYIAGGMNYSGRDRFIEPEAYTVKLLNSNHKLQAYQPADINGDGRADFVWVEASYGSDPSDYVPRLNYAIQNKESSNVEQGTFVGGTCSGSNNREVCLPEVADTVQQRLAALDFNADGRSDVAVFDHVNDKWNVYLSKPQSNGDWKLSGTPVTAPALNGQLTSDKAKFVDLNGDGLLDYLYFSANGLSVRYLVQDPNANIDSPEFYKFADAQELTAETPFYTTVPWVVGTDWRAVEVISAGADFNADGRADFILFGETNQTCVDDTHVNCPPRDRIHHIYTMTSDTSIDLYADLGANDQGHRAQAVDINGDSYADIVSSTYQSGSNTDNFYYRINKGDGTFENRVFFNEDTLGKTPDVEPNRLDDKPGADDPQFYDWNYDGYPDLIWKQIVGNPNTWQGLAVRYWDPTTQSFLAAQATGVPGVTTNSNESVFAADLTGNGSLKVINFDAADAEIRVIDRPGIPFNKITDIINGFGARTTVEYESLAITDRYDAIDFDLTRTPVQGEFCEQDDSPYREESCRLSNYYVTSAEDLYEELNGDWDLPANSQTIGRYRPVMEFAAPMYIVTAMQSSAPALVAQPAGFTMDHDAQSRITYHYGEAKIQAAGRGVLGFEQLRTIDEQTGIVTTTRYRQDWPFIGHPVSTERRSRQGHLLSTSTTRWEMLDYDASFTTTAESSGTAALGPLFVVSSEAEEKTHELLNNGAAQGQVVSHMRTSTTSFTENGNPLEIVKYDLGNNGTELRRQTTTNTYHPGFDDLLARLATADVTTTRPDGNGTVTRKTAFDYYPSGLLREEVSDPDDSSIRVTTVHSYDSFGNVVRSTASTIDGTRCDNDVSLYDSTGRYVDKAFDCLGRLTSEVKGRNHFGMPTELHNIVDVSGGYTVTEIAYGLFGHEYFRGSSNGAFQTDYFDQNLAQCPVDSIYREVGTAAGGVESATCHDVIGRTTRELTKGFSGTWIAKDTQYDASGRTQRTSEPYYLGANEPIYWSTVEYDLVGRPIKTTMPDSTVGRTAYSAEAYTIGSQSYTGTKVISTNARNYAKTEVYNRLGELVRSVNALSGVTKYGYDTQGNMNEIVSNGGTPNNTTVINFDTANRKVSMNDPDKGYWQYRHNAFGELVAQQNANGHSTVLTYDALGRMRTRIDCINTLIDNCNSNAPQESSSTWTYDTGANAFGQLVSVEDTVSGYYQSYSFDAFGRSDVVTTNFDGSLYKEKTTYDEFGRVFQVFDAAGDGSFVDSAIRHRYNSYGYLSSVEDAVVIGGQSRRVYQTIGEMTARGQVKVEVLGNDVITSREYDDSNGRLEDIVSTSSSGNVQNLHYEWDVVGNLKVRHDQSAGKNLRETFNYDALNRLDWQRVDGRDVITLTYDEAHLGNIKSKSDVGSYEYNSSKPHAVTSVDGDVFTYDANGNNLTGDGRVIEYTTFDKPSKISKGSDSVEFEYDPNRSRFRRIDKTASGEVTTRYIGSVEIVSRPDGTEKRKRYIAGVAIEIDSYTNFGASLVDKRVSYTHFDHLGSMDVITDDVGAVEQVMSFDAWGQRRDGNWQIVVGAALIAFDTNITTRGFTGHEMLDLVGIIHMNGRIYDGRIGRFLQADPFVQEPSNSQSLNRYAYVLNNPLNKTDPTGYFFEEAAQLIIAITAIAVSGGSATPFFSTWYGAATVGAVTGALSAAIVGGDPLKGALFGAVSAIAFNAIGAKFDGIAAARDNPCTKLFQSLTAGEKATKILAHAVTGGAMGKLQGGKFGHGFISAGVTQALSGQIDRLDAGNAGFSAERTIAAALLGGTASALSGGKFVNGAITGAFSRAYNDEAKHSHQPTEELTADILNFPGMRKAISQAEQAAYNKMMLIAKGNDLFNDPDPNDYVTQGVIIDHGFGYHLSVGRPSLYIARGQHLGSLASNLLQTLVQPSNQGAPVPVKDVAMVVIVVPNTAEGAQIDVTKHNYRHAPNQRVITIYRGRSYLTRGDLGPLDITDARRQK